MDQKCATCTHKPVCFKYVATGGVNKCTHYKSDTEESVQLRFCPYCGELINRERGEEE